MKKIELIDIFGNKKQCFVSNINERNIYDLKLAGFDFICTWWCGAWQVCEYERPGGQTIAIASL